MPPDPPRGQGPPGLADWGSRGGDSKSPDSPRARVKVECNTVGMLHPPLCPRGQGGRGLHSLVHKQYGLQNA